MKISSELKIREIDPNSEAEINLVAGRMRQSLVEVLGEDQGVALYTMGWLVSRVKWHLDATQIIAKVFLVETKAAEIVAHAIARIEVDETKNLFGYFSTIFVEENSRNQGIASGLIAHVESWFLEKGLPKSVYNTAENHIKLIRLFERHGYQIAYSNLKMVQLVKRLDPPKE